MALDADQIEAIAADLVEQRRSGTNVAFPIGQTPSRDDIDKIQMRVTQIIGNGGRPAAYKVSWLPLALVDSADEQPCFAGIPAGRLYDNGAELDSGSHKRRLGCEIEIACRLTIDEAGQPRPAAAMLGIEVIEEHSDVITKETIRALRAAGLFNQGYVLGPELEGWSDLKAMFVRVWKNDDLIHESTIGDQFDPDERLKLFLDHAGAARWPLQAGTIVSLGALNKDVWASPGDRFKGEIAAFGQVAATIR